NTWFGYGCALHDSGNSDIELRSIARVAAQSGVEVFVVDAGWYLGNPTVPFAEGRGFPGAFDRGLGTGVANPDKWQATPGRGRRSSTGSPTASSGSSPAIGSTTSRSMPIWPLETNRPTDAAATSGRAGRPASSASFRICAPQTRGSTSSIARPGSSDTGSVC